MNILVNIDVDDLGKAVDFYTREYARHWMPLHLDFVVDDIEAAVSRAVAAGAALEKPLSDNAYGRLALLADPFGHGFCLLEYSEAGYDAITE